MISTSKCSVDYHLLSPAAITVNRETVQGCREEKAGLCAEARRRTSSRRSAGVGRTEHCTQAASAKAERRRLLRTRRARQTVLIGTRTHTPPTLFQAGSASASPTATSHNDLLGLHRLNMGMEKYYASPAESRRPVRRCTSRVVWDPLPTSKPCSALTRAPPPYEICAALSSEY